MELPDITRKVAEKVAERAKGGEEIPARVIALDFGDEGVIRIVGTATPPKVDNDPEGEADCRLKLSRADFMDIVAGRQSPQAAYMTGKVKLEGDLGLAMQLGKLLG